MEKKSRSRGCIITRSDFLKGTAYVTLGVALGLKNVESMEKTVVSEVLTKSGVKMVKVPGGW
ncbi:hypothetical protein KA005_53945, partial [bacterium]|nr:hypothetical protein [bacterium]